MGQQQQQQQPLKLASKRPEVGCRFKNSVQEQCCYEQKHFFTAMTQPLVHTTTD